MTQNSCKGDWQVNGAALPAGDSAIFDAPGRVELVVSGSEAELYVVQLTMEARGTLS